MGLGGRAQPLRMRKSVSPVQSPVAAPVAATPIAEKGALGPGQRYGGGGRGHRTVLTETWARNPNNYTAPPISSNPGQGPVAAPAPVTAPTPVGASRAPQRMPIKLGAQVTRRRTVLGG